MLSELKQDLINKITATNDESLLLLLKTDYDYFAQDSLWDAADELQEEDKKELINLLNEPFAEDTITQQEFDDTIRQWRTR